jgi:predicted dehydrogenase
MLIRWGVLGCGSIATQAIAPAIGWSGTGELLAIGSRSHERATKLKHLLGASRAYGSYEELLADRDVDAVYIGLPNGEHARWALAAAAAGKHVLCEKSLALTVADARALREAFAERRLRLMEAFMVRHHPQWALVRRILEERADDIGPVHHVRSWFRATLDRADDHRWSPVLGGGALFDLTCYAINAARFVLREEPERALATATLTSSGVDSATDALLVFRSGAVASVHGSLRAPFEQGLVVSGERGRIVVERPFVPYWNATQVIVEDHHGVVVHEVEGANAYLHMVEHFEACVLDASRPLGPAEDGFDNVAACALVAAAAIRAR